MADEKNDTIEKIRGIKGDHILSEDEVEEMTRLLSEILREDFPHLPEEALDKVEENVRLEPLRKRFQSAREYRGLSIKEAAAQLKVPQYRLKAIEELNVSEIKPDIFRKYSALLGLDDWVSEWAAANKKLAAEIGII